MQDSIEFNDQKPKDMTLHFDLPKEQSSIIKVIGVGGGGSNAVNHMYQDGISGVNFVVCNTDSQALDISPVPNKIQLGPELTEGLGAGSNPEVGREACEESMETVREILEKNTKMVFVTAGMGGGTGTGGAPVIAKLAREMGILTVGIVTTPFSFEGRRKLSQAEAGIQRLRESVDTILIISNDKIREIYGNLTKSDAFANADDILATAARSISEIITVPGEINVDFADVEYVMRNSGVAIMGNGEASGDDRAMRAVQGAMNSPLLNDNDIRGAKNILINISSSESHQVTIDEITEINEFVQEVAGNDTDIIFGTCDNSNLGEKLYVTIIATGFSSGQKHTTVQVEERTVHKLSQEENKQAAEELSETLDEMRVVNETEVEAETSNEIELSLEEAVGEEPVSASTSPVSDDPDLQFELKVTPTQPEEAQKDETQLSFYTTQSAKDKEEEQKQSEQVDERKRILRDLSYKWNNNNSMSELENEPAYKRRGVDLEPVHRSTDTDQSNFRVDESDTADGSARPEIRKDNRFLHDNVD